MYGKQVKRNMFDFELGYMTKSPCLECKNRKDSPGCYDKCELLDKVRTILAQGISTQASTFRT